MSEKVENATFLFQLLLKYELKQEKVSLQIIKILEGHLKKIEGGIGSQLRAAFVSEFLEKIVLERMIKLHSIEACKEKRYYLYHFYIYY